MYYECCACKSSRQDAILHHFPCNEKRLAKWLKYLNRDDLKSLSPEQLSKLFVCQKHFEKKFITSKSRLIGSAYPSLFSEDEILTGTASRQNDENVLPQAEHSYSRKRHFDHTYSLEPLKEIQEVASTSNEFPLQCLPQYPQSSQDSEVLASSSCDLQTLVQVPQNPPTIQESENSYHQFPHPEKNPDGFNAWVQIAGGKLDSQADYELYRKKVICDIHFTDRDRNHNHRLNFLAVPSLHLPDHHQQKEVPSFLLNQLKTTRTKIKILQSNLIRSQKKNKTFQSRIASDEKMSTDVLLKKLTIGAKILTKMQYTQTSKKPSGLVILS